MLCHSLGTSFRICSDQPALPHECRSLTNVEDCSVSSINVSVLFVCQWLLTKIAPRFFFLGFMADPATIRAGPMGLYLGNRIAVVSTKNYYLF